MVFYLVFRTFETEFTHFIIPFFPDEPDKSFGFYNDLLWLCFDEMLWLSLFFLLGWIALIYVPLYNAFSRIESLVLGRSTLYLTIVITLTLVASLVVSYYTLRNFPNSADEYAYLYQAETLSQGKLTQQAHPLENFFHFHHIAQIEGVSVGRFPPGWPMLLSIPFILNLPAYWLNPILGIVALVFFYSFSKRYYGERVAFWSVVSLAFSAYYIFNSASFFSHTSCMLFTLGFVYCLYLNQEKKSDLYGILAGIFLGMIVITRYYNAVLIFLPVLISFFYQYRWKAIRPLIFIGLGSFPFFVFLFWYNLQITGNGFLPVTVWAESSERLGFVKGHTFVKGIEHSIRRILLFLYWCSPALVILYFIYLYNKIRDKAQRFLRPEDYYLILLMIGYFFYHHLGGNQYGPRFLFEALPFLIVFVVSKTFQARAKWPLALFAAGLIYGVIKIPHIIQREHQIVNERMDVYDQVAEAGISNAVILISTHTSVRRPMPIRDLTRNDMDYKRDIIYAQDQREKNQLLMDYYPNRSFYKYIRDNDAVKGEFIKLR